MKKILIILILECLLMSEENIYKKFAETATDQEIYSFFNDISLDINSQVPFNLDSITVLDSMVTSKRSLLYSATIMLNKDEIKDSLKNEVEKQNINKLCSTPFTRVWLKSLKANISYFYYDIHSIFVASVNIDEEVCLNNGVNWNEEMYDQAWLFLNKI